MAYKYIVKLYSWRDGKIVNSKLEFSNESDAVNYAKNYGLAETIKIYYDNQVLFSENKTVMSNSYA